MTAIQRVKLRLYLKAIPQCLIVLLSLTLTAWITGKYIETACFAISFCVLRYRFDDILHCSTTFKCNLLSNAIVFVFIPITIPLTSSLFGGIISGFAVNYFANLIASSYCRMSERKELDKLRKEKHEKDVYSLDELSLRVYCKSYNLDFIDEEIVIQRLIYHLRGTELYSKIGYSKPQMIRREKQIESKLNIKLK
jgi:hypothetical protein